MSKTAVKNRSTALRLQQSMYKLLTPKNYAQMYVLQRRVQSGFHLQIDAILLTVVCK